MKLSLHQKRVLAALFALQQSHGLRWWGRHAIGDVVGAGGFHVVIQVGTIRILKRLGLVQSERSSWPPEVAELVRCNCANCEWGLTVTGFQAAQLLNVQWDADTLRRIDGLSYYAKIRPDRDEDEFGQYVRRPTEDDEDDDDLSGESWKGC